MSTAPRPSSYKSMADKRDDVNWSDKASIWASLPSAKSAVSRWCTAIDKLIERKFIYSTPTACEDTRKHLAEAFDFCVELHDRWSDLENESGSTTVSETANKSLGPYEDKQFTALAKLDKYVPDNMSSDQVASTSADVTSAGGSQAPKLSTCKLLFPEKLTKSNTPSEFRLWISAFKRFYEASSLKEQSVATQQGCLLQALSAELQEVVEQKITPSMPIFGSVGCLDVLEGEFGILHPIFNRRVEYFQVIQEQGESSEEFYRCLTRLSDMADLEALSKEELKTFRFIGSLQRQGFAEIRSSISSARMPRTVRDAIAQHDLQQKADDALASKSVAAVKQAKARSRPKPRRGREWVGLPPELEGQCAGCGETSHMARNCPVRKK